MDKTRDIKVVLCDLDGVVWLAHEPIRGSVEAIRQLRDRGTRVMFVTNNSFSTTQEQHDALGLIGLESRGDLVTSSMAAASIIEPHWRVLVCGGAGLREEVGRVAREVVVAHENKGDSARFDAVVVGMHREFNYDVLSMALTALDDGAVLIGSNADPTYPTPRGPSPGGGSILAAIATASGREPIVTGKPADPMAQLVRSLCPDIDPGSMLMVGDRPDTDGAFATTIGCRFGLVLSGVTQSAEGLDYDWIAPNLGALVDQLSS